MKCAFTASSNLPVMRTTLPACCIVLGGNECLTTGVSPQRLDDNLPQTHRADSCPRREVNEMASEITSDQLCSARTGKITVINSSLSYTDKSNQVVIVQILNVQHESHLVSRAGPTG